PRDEPVRIALDNVDYVAEWHSDTGRINLGIVVGIHLTFRDLPAQQPGALDAGGAHVVDHSSTVVSGPSGVTMHVVDLVMRCYFAVSFDFLSGESCLPVDRQPGQEAAA